MAKVFTVPQLSPDDVRALGQFLNSEAAAYEENFHRLLEDHPALLGALGYVRFLSELPIAKRDSYGLISKYKDRPDILAGRPSKIKPHLLYVDIIELKAIERQISDSVNPQRLSSVAARALSQLYTYEKDLITNMDFQTELNILDFSIAEPQKILILGRDAEFENCPYAYERISAQFRAHNVIHYTGDDFLRMTETALEQKVGSKIVANVPPKHVKLILAGDRNWKITIVDNDVVAKAEKLKAVDESLERLMEKLTSISPGALDIYREQFDMVGKAEKSIIENLEEDVDVDSNELHTKVFWQSVYDDPDDRVIFHVCDI